MLVPAFNCAQYVQGAIESALEQQNVSLEVIAIDDGSTDNTWSLLEGFGSAIRRYRLDHGGPYRARNFGARHALGQWIAFLDGDDQWEPQKLRTQLARATRETALVYTNCRNIGDTGRIRPLQSDNISLHEGQIFTQLVMGNCISLSSAMVRRSWFESLGGFAEKGIGIQDWDLWLRIAAEGGEIRLCRQPLTMYRHHGGQMSKRLDDRLGDRLEVLRTALNMPAARFLGWRKVRLAYANALKVSAWQAAGDRRRALKWYLRSALYWPFDAQPYKQSIKCLLGRV